MAKTWKLTVDEDELKAFILHHTGNIFHTPMENKVNPDTSARLHDLVKRLNKETPDIETEVKNNGDNQQTAAEALAVKPDASPASWG